MARTSANLFLLEVMKVRDLGRDLDMDIFDSFFFFGLRFLRLGGWGNGDGGGEGRKEGGDNVEMSVAGRLIGK